MSDYTIPSGRPLSNKILIKLLPKPEKTKGGIILTEAATVNPLVEAVVILVSPEVKSVQQFDKVLVPKDCGTPVEIDGENYRFIQEQDPFYII